MKIVFVDTNYAPFLAALYRSGAARRSGSYEAQLRAIVAARFGTSDFMSRAFSQRGDVEASDVVANCLPLQARWAIEHDVALPPSPRQALAAVLDAQLSAAGPDVVWVLDIEAVSSEVLRRASSRGAVVVGQVAAALSRHVDIGPYDALVSSLPHFVDWFARLGGRARYVPLAFDPCLLAEIGARPRERDVVFVGGMRGVHGGAAATLETLVAAVPGVELYGPAPPEGPAARARYRGAAWGNEMYALLAEARVAWNRHAPFALGFANNMRLFEATGMGALLLTDRKPSLPSLFSPDEEVVTWRSAEECADKARWLLDHPAERAAIAAAGQRRTLRDHTYERRAAEALPLLTGLLADRPPRRGRVGLGAARRAPLERAARVLARALPDSLRAALDRARLARSLARLAGRSGAFGAGSDDEALYELHMGRPGVAFRALAEAVARTGHARDAILTVGLDAGADASRAGGPAGEALFALLGHELRITRVDATPPERGGGAPADAPLRALAASPTRLPFADESFDIVVVADGAVRVPDRRAALAEAARVCRAAVVVHRAALIEGDLAGALGDHGLKVAARFEVDAGPPATATYVCFKRPGASARPVTA